MSTNPEQSKQRIQFDFTPDSLRRLEELKRRTDAITKAEVVRNALKLYEWLVTEVDPDYIIEIKDKEGNTLYKIPARAFL
ncbi:MAG TPA: hypothetical protein VFB12_09360 [Ktedonobacteraceae bacterium]|nr:hypothetical protein [Ktedonobacteraceae bacterium]